MMKHRAGSPRKAGAVHWALLISLLALAPRTSPAAVQACPHDSIVVDVAGANSLIVAIFDGRGVGQLITAQDTLISAVSFWVKRVVGTDPYKIQLFIGTIDSTLMTDFVDTIYIGPVASGLSTTVPTRVDFNLTPPASLPRPGKYLLVFNEESCLGEFNAMADTTNPYSGGAVWLTGATACDGRGSGSLASPPYATTDLIFRVVFCDTATPVQPTSWGRVKAIYR